MNFPEYAKVGNKKYKINTDFRVAIKCNSVANDKTIGDYERALAIIYMLYGDEGLKAEKDHNRLLEIAKKYLSCGEEVVDNDEEPDMDFEEDMNYIEASFMSDYHMDLSKEKMHWWKFYNLINGLSDSEMGNSCVLNRIRSLRKYDVSKIEDRKEREKIIKAKERFALKKTKKENNLTHEQVESMNELDELLGLKK